MKLLQSAQKAGAIIGLAADRQPFNSRVKFILVIFGSMIIFYCVYLVDEANTFIEYTANFYLLSSVTLITSCYISFALKIETEKELLAQFDKFVEMRKFYSLQKEFKSIPQKLNENLF